MPAHRESALFSCFIVILLPAGRLFTNPPRIKHLFAASFAFDLARFDLPLRARVSTCSSRARVRLTQRDAYSDAYSDAIVQREKTQWGRWNSRSDARSGGETC